MSVKETKIVPLTRPASPKSVRTPVAKPPVALELNARWSTTTPSASVLLDSKATP